MTLEASRDALVSCGAGWDGVADEMMVAVGKLFDAQGQGYQFGFLAQAAGIDSQHDQFVTSMINALPTGAYKVGKIADVLRETARDFGETDLEVADQFHDEDGTPR